MNTNPESENNLNKEIIARELEEMSSRLDPSSNEASIILAAGHGKRIKSEKSKMLHEIWGKPSVYRVSEAARRGLASTNQVVVVGIKALDVAQALGKEQNRAFVFQQEQRGTGHAVRSALSQRELMDFQGSVFIFPGDMGLLSRQTVKDLRKNFYQYKCDMLVLTGYFEGDIDENYYGRIVTSHRDRNKLLEIKEHKDILAMTEGQSYSVTMNGIVENFSREELLNIRDFNVGVYAIKLDPLRKFIDLIESNNVQGEIYITDLIKIFNEHGLKVRTSRVANNNLVVSFNVKSVLKQMDKIFMSMMYEKLKDIIMIDDPEDFYIAEETVQNIIEMDRQAAPLDIHFGKGVHIGEQVKLNRGVSIEKNAILKGNVHLGRNVTIGESVVFSTYPEQVIEIDDNSHIFRGNVIQGSVKIGVNVRVETGVRITGSSKEPVIIGDNVLIKGMTYIFGSIIENDITIEHSILKSMYVEKVVRKDGEVQPVRYILPHPEGLDSISDLRR